MSDYATQPVITPPVLSRKSADCAGLKPWCWSIPPGGRDHPLFLKAGWTGSWLPGIAAKFNGGVVEPGLDKDTNRCGDYHSGFVLVAHETDRKSTQKNAEAQSPGVYPLSSVPLAGTLQNGQNTQQQREQFLQKVKTGSRNCSVVNRLRTDGWRG